MAILTSLVHSIFVLEKDREHGRGHERWEGNNNLMKTQPAESFVIQVDVVKERVNISLSLQPRL